MEGTKGQETYLEIEQGSGKFNTFHIKGFHLQKNCLLLLDIITGGKIENLSDNRREKEREGEGERPGGREAERD